MAPQGGDCSVAVTNDAPPELRTSSVTHLAGVDLGISSSGGTDAANASKSLPLSPNDQQKADGNQHDHDHKILAHRLSGLDFALQDGYMRALMNFAEDSNGYDMVHINDHVDADFIQSGGGDVRQLDEGPSQEPKVTPPPIVESGAETWGNDSSQTPKANISYRISRFPFTNPFTWQPGQDQVPGHAEHHSTTTLVEAGGAPSPSKVEVDPSTLEVFESLASVATDELELVKLHDIDTTPDQDRAMSSVSMTLETIEETMSMSLVGVKSVVFTVSSSDSLMETGSASSVANQNHLSIFSSTRRPSTATSRSTGSVSGASSNEETKLTISSSPRGPASLFGRFRSRPSASLTTTDDRPTSFIERRTLTPHGRLAPVPRGEEASLERPLPPLPDGASDADRIEPGLVPWDPSNPTLRGAPVFGIDLNQSIKLAPMKVRISHKGSSASQRLFPRSVYKCCEFIRRSDPIDPNLFSSPGDAYNVSHLRDIFNTAPFYGEHFSFSDSGNAHYTTQDAARLILMYLQALPKPLVPSSVAKSWILLARQEGAIAPACSRPLESGLDFWVEALNRLPTANRNLVKHLLTMWAETVMRKDGSIMEADARNLASTVSRAVFQLHEEGGKKSVHATLALAFLIRKRGDDLRARGGEEGWAPSTREILGWRGRGGWS